MARTLALAFSCSCAAHIGHAREVPTGIVNLDSDVARSKRALLDKLSYSSPEFSSLGSHARKRGSTPRFLDSLRRLLLRVNCRTTFPYRFTAFCPSCVTTDIGTRAPAAYLSDDFKLRRIFRTKTPEVPVDKVVDNLLAALQSNDFPEANAGVKAFWDWTSPMYRASPLNGRGNFDVFLERSKDSYLAQLIGAKTWILEPISGSDNYASQIACVVPANATDKSVLRRFAFQLEKEKRAYYKGAWSVISMFVSDSEGRFVPPSKW